MILLLAFLFVQDAPIASEAEAAKVVDEISKKPEIFHQTCFGMEREANITYGVSSAGPAPRFERQISTAQFAKLRRMREGAVMALSTWASKLSVVGDKDDEGWEDFSRTKLAMIVDLNATATLPALRKMADTLKKAYDASPVADNVDWGKVRDLPPDKQNAIHAKVRASDRLGDVTSTILALLRQEKFEPLLESPLEQELQAAVAKSVKGEGIAPVLSKIRKNGGKVDEDDRDVVFADPVSGDYVTLHCYPKQKLDAATFAKVLAWVDEYAKRPAEKRRDAKGMSAWPVNR